MKILVVPKEFPHGRVIGGPIIVYNRIKYLSRRHQIGLASFVRNEDRQHLDTLEPYLSELETMPYPPRRNVFHRISDFFFSEVPSYMCNTKSSEMFHTIGTMTQRSHYDVVIAEYSVMGQYLYQNPGINPRTKRIISCHECYTIARKKVHDLYGIFSSLGFKALLELYRLEGYEFAMYRDVDKVITLTSQEREGLLGYAPDLDISVIPHGVDTEMFTPVPSDKQEMSVAFVGNYPHDPNRDAVIYFVKEIWPHLKKILPQIKFYVIGRDPTPDILATAERDQNIVVTGTVEDVRDYLKRAKVFVAPIRLGKGFRGKILEAMAMGIPVVSTSLGAEGFPTEDMNNIAIANDPETFVDRVARLLKDDGLHRQIAKNARTLVEKKFSWEKGVEVLEEVLEKVVAKG
jgi:glycosyltransferase involved in cell wall biosynthesis